MFKVVNTLSITLLFAHSATLASGLRVDPIQDALKWASAYSGVSNRLLRAVCKAESNLQAKAYRHQDGGSPSYGLCQVKLNTCRGFGFEGKGKELFNPYTNALCAGRYLRYQYGRYGSWAKAVSAYNRGNAEGGITNHAYVIRVLELALE